MPLTVQKVDVGTSSVFAPKHTAGELDTLPFRAAIWDRLAVDWWLSGPPTYNVQSYSAIKKTETGPLASFLSVFLAAGRVTPVFLRLCSVPYPPPPSRRRAVRRGHGSTWYDCQASEVGPLLAAPARQCGSGAAAIRQRHGAESEWVLLTQAQ